MATATYVAEGNMVDYTPDSAVAAGDVVVQNNLVGVALSAIAAAALGALCVDGIFDFPKSSGTSTGIAAGKTVYWDAENSVMTETSEGNTLAGKCVKAAADDDTTVRVRLSM